VTRVCDDSSSRVDVRHDRPTQLVAMKTKLLPVYQPNTSSMECPSLCRVRSKSRLTNTYSKRTKIDSRAHVTPTSESDAHLANDAEWKFLVNVFVQSFFIFSSLIFCMLHRCTIFIITSPVRYFIPPVTIERLAVRKI